jgi:DnaJ-class molecular chaperone
MEYKDYYAVLGVPRTASQAEIKRAFRKLAREHHPDVRPDDRAAERRFKEISEANEVLSDPEKRTRYDTLGSNWDAYQRAGAGGADPFGPGSPFAGFRTAGSPGNVRCEFAGEAGDFSEFFRTFFSGMGGAPGGRGSTAAGSGRGRSRARVETDAFGGGSIEDLLAGFGAGTRGPGRGAGGPQAASRPQAAPPATRATVHVSLEDAFGGATRLVDLDGKRLEVKIPAGVDTGSKIRLRGRGGGEGETARDLILTIAVTPHPVFTREGSDLVRELPISLREALLGAEVPVRGLGGRLLLTIPPGTQSGRTFRLAGQGMPKLRGEGRGALLVRTRVILPTLDDAGRRAAAAFLDSISQPSPRGD